MRASCWPDWLDQVWAKSAEKGEGGQPETLAQHTWAVLERLADFIHLRPDLPGRLGVPRLWYILYWAALLHDFGKATAGFQGMLRQQGTWPHRHEVISLAFLDWLTPGMTRDEMTWAAAAIASHHRDAEYIALGYPMPQEDDDDPLVERVAEIDRATVHGLWRWVAECGSIWFHDLGLDRVGVTPITPVNEAEAVQAVTQHGAARIHYWLDMYRRLTRDIERRADRELAVQTLALRGFIINADHSASAHAPDLPRVMFAVDTPPLEALRAKGFFQHQMDAEATHGSALLTAPTGSGKTEAALLWAARQARDGDGLPRLFYTLPYQASMNAMKLRLEDHFPHSEPSAASLVGLQHGRGLMALYRMLLEEKDNPRKAAYQARWARNLANLNYPPVRVFSPYQMLKGMYRLKGYEALLSDYHDAVFVFDEIHAYEVRRLAMILKTIEYLHRHFNARFLVMSATFPSLIKEWLQEALGGAQIIEADDDLYKAFQRHRLVMLDGELTSEEGIGRIVRDAEAGKSVLVVCNLVDRAQEVYERLVSRLRHAGVEGKLLHGRFNVHDRLTKEGWVRDAVGSKSETRKSEGIVLVATQVVEVSLDIDLDTVYTDPAPLEALIQRFGRINRSRRYKAPNLAPVHVFREPRNGQIIYNEALVQRTLTILDREADKFVDESAIGWWLDEIYHGDIEAQWRRDYAKAAQEFEDVCIRKMRPFQSDTALEEEFYKAFDSIEVLPESLADEYRRLRDGEPIRAGELLTPISWRRFMGLTKQRRVRPREKGEPPIVAAPYSSELGLTFD